MYRSACITFLAISLCLTPLPSHADDSIRVMLWNIECGLDVSGSSCGYVTGVWKYFLPHSTPVIKKIGRAVMELKPDILALTEVENPSFRNRWKDQPGIISSLTSLPSYVFYSTNRFLGLGNQGNALLSRYRITDWKALDLPGGLEQRKLCKAVISIDDTEVAVYVTHLALGCTRKRQIERIAFLMREENRPLILVGDFNTDDPDELEPLRAAGLVEGNSPKTCPSWDPDEAIDRVFVRGWEIVSVEVVDIRMSDHLPLLVVLKRQNPAGETPETPVQTP